MDREKIYYSVREVMRETLLPLATLRYWESRFAQLNPRKDGHGNRYYTSEDVRLIKQIKYIRDELKITRIDAIQRELQQSTLHTDARQQAAEILKQVKNELIAIRAHI